MKNRLLITTAIALAGFAMSDAMFAAPPTPFPDTANASTPVKVRDPKIAAERFVEHINYARVALAMQNPQAAEDEIAHARRMMAIIRGEPSKTTLMHIGSGRVVYEQDTDYKYHYYPIETGPVEIKKMSKGPFWAKKGLAVTDAEIVYLTLDLTTTKPDQHLNAADGAIKAGKLDDADRQLAELTEQVVSVEDAEAMPLDQARDNITLARDFIATNNYDGARYALGHADEALDDAENDKRFSTHRHDIHQLRHEVTQLERNVARNDPSALSKADAKMAQWWHELKSWAKTEKQEYAPAR